MVFLKRFKLKHIIILLFVIGIGFAMKFLFWPAQTEPSYITTYVEQGDIEKTVLADGTINAYKLVSVGAQASGQIKKLYVELGDEVSVGDMVAEIDDLKQNNDLKQSEASLASLEAERQAKEASLKYYQITYERQQQLVNKGAGIQSDLDNAIAELDVIKAEISALEADIISAKVAVDTAKVNLAYTKILSPIDGVVVAIPVEEGQTVNAVQSTPTIVKVAQLDKMTVEAQISEADVIDVKTGMSVYFTILGRENQRFSDLTLRSIEPAPTSISTDTTSSSTTAIYYNGLFDVDNSDQMLRISMTAQVYIVLDQAKDVLYIPYTSIQNNLGNNKATVFVLDEENRLHEKEIEIGIDDSINVEVKSGLTLGDTIVISRFDGSMVSDKPAARIRF